MLAVDSSPEFCAMVSSWLEIPVQQLFGELDDVGCYDGIQAFASILRVSSADLPGVFRRMITALKPGGIIYASFKYCTFEGEQNGRWFTDFAEVKFASFMLKFPGADVRPGRADEKWLNVIIKKRSF